MQVENQRGVLQAHRVAADSVVEGPAGEGGAGPVQEHAGGAVGLGVDMVGRGRRRHQAVPHG